MLDDGITLFIELGPHPVLLPSIQQTASAEGKQSVPPWHSVSAINRSLLTLLSAFGTLWVNGFPIDWRKIVPVARRTDLPLYPWQRERHWLDTADAAHTAAGTRVKTTRPDDESLGWLHQFTWTALAPPAVGATAAGDSVDPVRRFGSKHF